MRYRPRERGFSFLEIAIVLAISAVIVVAVYAVVFGAQRGDEAIRARVEIEIEATRAIQTLTSYFKTAGAVDTNGNGVWDPGEYPVFTNDGTPFPSAYGSFTDLQAVSSAGTNNAASHFISTVDSEGYGGVSNEVLFRLPRDKDGDKHPTDSQGQIEWGKDNVPTETAYYAIVIIHNPACRQNELHLREYNGSSFGTTLLRKRVIATNIDRIQFMAQGNPVTNVPTGFLNVGAGNYDPNLGRSQLRITLWFWKKDINGKDVKLIHSTTVNMRTQ